MSRLVTAAVIAVLAVFLLSGVFAAGLAFGTTLPATEASGISLLEILPTRASPDSTTGEDPSSEVGAEPQTRDELIKPFWEAWAIVHDQYVDPVDDTLLVQGAIDGMLDSLGDPHTSYMDPFEYEQSSTSLDGSYEGIGAWVDADAEFLTIISPMPDSPAEHAGLKPGDQIIGIDGEDVTGIDANLVIRRVLGPAGTTVTLTVRRESVAEPFDVDITRMSIRIPTVEYEMVTEDIGYVRLFTFGRNSAPDLRDAIVELLKENPKGLIFDLRGNGGGFLNVAVEVASEFISEGVVLIERFGDGSEQTFEAQSGGKATEIPLVVLIDGGTASASEIVAGAIQDQGRALLIGETSFGKGSVQNWVPLEDEQGAVRVTIARWFTPGNRQIAEIGLEPNILSEITDENIAADEDPQLEAAIEELERGMN